MNPGCSIPVHELDLPSSRFNTSELVNLDLPRAIEIYVYTVSSSQYNLPKL